MSAAQAAPMDADRHHDENFPVASFILKKPHREAVMAFYRFARKADDIADDDVLPRDLKMAGLERMRAALEGQESADDAEAQALRAAAARRGLSTVHGLDLLEAFRRDVGKSRYQSFEELMDYCRYSAMPVGRFVLDVHGENKALWPASDALCAALQIINHLQDCAKDYKALDRVYLPLDLLEAEGCAVESLAASAASPALLRVLRDLANRVRRLLEEARPFAAGIRDARLAYEVAVIQRLAEDLARTLLVRDPLSERVRHGRAQTAALAVLGTIGAAFERRRARR